MTNMLPALTPARLSLADVMPGCLAAITGERAATSGEATLDLPRVGLPQVDGVAVVLVDGLGVSALRARSGHARFLSSRLSKRSILFSGFPTTTVAGITSLTTGARPGTHGLVAYRVLDAAHDRVVNQLTGWDDEMTPSWQRCDTMFEQAAEHGVASYAVGPERYSDTGFTQAALRGAQYVSADSMADRFTVARDLLATSGKKLVYVYVPELDSLAHAKGSESEAWLARLEELDGLIAGFASSLPARTAALVTADHGILDVPASNHVLFGDQPQLVDAFRHIGGEPRCLHLYFDPAVQGHERQAVTDVWRNHESHRSWVATRQEAIDANWFGAVDDAVRPRIGDLIIAARKRIAYYDVRAEDQGPRRMIGQHGSLTADETQVPLIGLGAFS